MARVKIHEEFYSVDTTDEWKDRTTVSVYLFDTETKELILEKTKTFRDYRSNTESTDPTTTEAVPLHKAPKVVQAMLLERGLISEGAI